MLMSMSRTRTLISLVVASLLSASATHAQAPQPAKPAAGPAEQAVQPTPKRIDVAPADIKWLDRIAKDDRAAFDELLGYAPPAFADHIEWIGTDALNWDALRGKVVVIQSFTTGTTAGRNWPTRVAKALESHKPADLRIIALHTPEDAANATTFLARRPAPDGVAVAIDRSGTYCDELAIFRQPANIVIDRNGTVRYAALNINGLEQAVAALVAEPFDAKIIASKRSDDDAAVVTDDAAFPPFSGTVSHATDIRGQRAPEFTVTEWLNTSAPNARNKVVVLDFWATWCGPCIATIPHMNELASRFSDDVLCVGISDEKRSAFDSGMTKLKPRNITMDTFKYPLALDPAGTMKKAIKITGIPHAIVMDRNWIVRWQGHPASLDAATLEKIVSADKASGSGGGGSGSAAKPSGGKRKRWSSAR